MQFAIPEDLLRRFDACCEALGLDKPAAGRVAIALFVEKGIDYAKNPPVGTGQAEGVRNG